jgi:hypothetical protein
MRKSATKYLACLLLLGSAAVASAANWPARIFAPYMYIGAGDDFQLTDCDDACGQKYYTIAFIIANQQNQPAWDGRFPLETNLYTDQINLIRGRGGDVIVSFGGEGVTELAIAETNLPALESKYQSVIDRYKLTWLDFDIEGNALFDQDANRRRNAVLARLQARNPGLIISYTLPVDPNGITKGTKELLTDAKAKGVRVYSGNFMIMYFGPKFNQDKKMIDLCIASALKAHEQCQEIDPAIQIGLTALIGKNRRLGEEFTQDDAKALKQWADGQPWVCSLSFWCSNRDAGKPAAKRTGNTATGIPQQPWEFTRIFQPFTSRR